MKTMPEISSIVLLIFIAVATPGYGQEIRNNIHPQFEFLDNSGNNAARSGNPVSLGKSCGICHDTQFIDRHGFHSQYNPGFQPGTLRQRIQDDSASARQLIRHTGGGMFTDEGLEFNCLICHLEHPDNSIRESLIFSGRFENIAQSMLGSERLEKSNEEMRFIPPDSDHCSSCHFAVSSIAEPVDWCPGSGYRENSDNTGIIYSDQKIQSSALNIKDKENLLSPWDAHAERLLECRHCHFSINNPAYAFESSDTRPKHLLFDPRRITYAEYLKKPSHQFAVGKQAGLPGNENWVFSMRRCEACHDAASTHEWLPYKSQHFRVLNCETCHIPYIHNTARQTIDYSISLQNNAASEYYRNCQGLVSDPTSYRQGYTPILLPVEEPGEKPRLSPYNLVTRLVWVDRKATDPDSPVTSLDRIQEKDLIRVFSQEIPSEPGTLSLFDFDRNGLMDDVERRIDTDEKKEAVRQLLVSSGYKNPTLMAEITAVSLNHGVMKKDFALKTCSECHSDRSRIFHTIDLIPFHSAPDMIQTRDTMPGITIDNSTDMKDNSFVFSAAHLIEKHQELHIIGKTRIAWIDSSGISLILMTIAGVFMHGGLRWISFYRNRRKN